MPLHTRLHPQADIRAYAAAQDLRLETAGALADHLDPDEIIAHMVASLSPEVIHGYAFEVGDKLRETMRERLSSNDQHLAASSADAFITYLSVLASTREMELRIEARRQLDVSLTAIVPSLSLAS